MKFLWISLIFLLPVQLKAASCCGGGASSSSVMTSDSKWSFSTSYSDVTILGDSQDNGEALLRADSTIETIRVTKLSSSYLVSSLWQIGIEVPHMEKIRQINSKWVSQSGVGDIKVLTAYEILPVYARTWKPRVYLYTGLSIPTSPSIFTTKRSDLLDTRGTGHYHYLLGSVMTKRLERFNLVFQPQVSYREARTFSDDNITGQKISTTGSLDSLMSFSASTTVGQKLSTSLTVVRNYMQSKAVSNFIGEGQPALVHDTTVGFSYSIDDRSDLNLNYTDQFLINEGYNHTLGKSLGVSYVIRKKL